VSLRDGGSSMTRPACPLAEFLSFRSNTRWYAEHWLRRGAVHPQEHWVISERLDPWRQRLAEAAAGLREALLAEILPEPVPLRAAPSPALTMPTGASAEAAGEGNGLPWHPSTPQIYECAQAIEATGKSQSSPWRARRAYHRRAEPRGTGRWAQKRRLAG
jgi:hypothetical protein